MYTPLNQYHVVMEVAPQYWQNPSALHEIYVRSPSGAQVPLSAVTRYEPTNTILSVNHQGQFPAVTLVVQYGCWRVARGRLCWLRMQPCATSVCRRACAGHFGNGQGVPILCRESTLVDSGGAGHGVHRAGDSL